jgi:hypothetical protein
MSERFTVRWFSTRGFVRAHHRPGFAVFCDGQRITMPFPTREEAERHAKRIAELYAGWGW